MTTFFAEPQNKIILKSFGEKLHHYINDEGSTKGAPDAALPLSQIVSMMIGNADAFDNLCDTGIKQIGSRFLDGMQSFNGKLNGADVFIRKKFVLGYRFLIELEINQGLDPSIDIENIRLWVNDNISKFPDDDRQLLGWIHYIFPASIVRQLINSPNVKSFRDFTAAFNAAEKSKGEWDEQLSRKKEEVEQLGAALEQYKTTYNFVGLVSAFQALLREKQKEKRFAFWCLMGIGAAILIPLGIQVGYALTHLDGIDKLKSGVILLLPPTLAIELFLFYFFRVVLAHFRIVKAHILQLDLRAALCQFIQSYAKYASEIKKADSTSLEKFESLVFSGIISSDEKLPTTFDGVEQLAGLVKSIRGTA